MDQFLNQIEHIGKFMKLPNYLRINKEDYPAESKLIIDRLGGSLNPGIEALFNALNNRLTVGDNMAAVIKDVIVTVDANGFPLTPTGIALGNLVPRANGSKVILAINQTDPNVYPAGAPFVSFTQNGQTFEIDHIAGLPANYQFLLRIEVQST